MLPTPGKAQWEESRHRKCGQEQNHSEQELGRRKGETRLKKPSLQIWYHALKNKMNSTTMKRTWWNRRPQGKSKSEAMRSSPTMCLQQQNLKEEGLRKSLKRSIQQQKTPPPSAKKKRTIKNKSLVDKGRKQSWRNTQNRWEENLVLTDTEPPSRGPRAEQGCDTDKWCLCIEGCFSYDESPRTHPLEGTSLHWWNNSVERHWGILSLFTTCLPVTQSTCHTLWHMSPTPGKAQSEEMSHTKCEKQTKPLRRKGG